MGVNKTSLSAGQLIRDILLSAPEVTKRTRKIFPVVTDEARLPYILYRRTAYQQKPTKRRGESGADLLQMEVICYTADYAEGVELAEAVRGALDNIEGKDDDLVMRSCTLQDAEESWQDDAYLQQLVFNINI